MLLVEEAVSLILRADAGLAGLVGTRIYPGVLPQTVTYPALVYRLNDREHTIHMEPRHATGLTRSEMILFSTGKNYADGKRVNEAVRLALYGFRGTVGTVPDTLDIQVILPLWTDELYEDRTQTWQVRASYNVYASEQLPV
jgi:hypothetical protein